jgi:hypothetical protein
MVFKSHSHKRVSSAYSDCYYFPRGWFHATDTIQQMPSATAACRHLPSAAGSWIVTTGGRGWRKASSDLLKGFRPLEPASLGKLSQRIKIVVAVGISRENLSGIAWWAFISLKQPLADFFGSVKDLIG